MVYLRYRDVCQQCCIEDNDIEETGKKYAKALLEVCWCKFPTMPQIEGESVFTSIMNVSETLQNA